VKVVYQLTLDTQAAVWATIQQDIQLVVAAVVVLAMLEEVICQVRPVVLRLEVVMDYFQI
jgi:hypothetical protein